MPPKKWYASKTIWFGVATAVLGFVESMTDVLADAGIENGWVVAALGTIAIILRAVTRQPVSK